MEVIYLAILVIMSQTSYFSHDANARNNPKLLELRYAHGMMGLGTFWCLIESLREAEATNYKIETKYIPYLAKNYEVPEALLFEIIHKFSLFKIEDDWFFSPSLNERMKIKDDKSKKGQEMSRMRWDASRNADDSNTHNPSNASKGKLRKVKVNKVKDNNKESENEQLVDNQVTCNPSVATIQKYGYRVVPVCREHFNNLDDFISYLLKLKELNVEIDPQDFNPEEYTPTKNPPSEEGTEDYY